MRARGKYYIHCQPELMKGNIHGRSGQRHGVRPQPLKKGLDGDRHGLLDPTNRSAIKAESKAIIRDWVNNLLGMRSASQHPSYSPTL